jgi:thioredoxin reductase
MQRSVIIVGAEIAGLSAACYARMNGYKTTIFESSNSRWSLHNLEKKGVHI